MISRGSQVRLEALRSLAPLQQALDRVFEQPLDWWTSGVSGRGAFPPLNVFSGPDGYVVKLNVPGLDAASIRVETQGDALQISGKRVIQAPASAGFARRERWDGEFVRALRLPEQLDLGAAQAEYRAGVLTLRIPQRAQAKPRQIPVSSIASGAGPNGAQKEA